MQINRDIISRGYRLDLVSNPLTSIEESKTSCLLFQQQY